jgi:cobalt/nickel transport system permease protein
MAHIPDGVLSAPVLVAGGIAATALTAVAVRRLDEARIPQTAVLSATFFVASLVHIPVGPSSVHPLLGGLMGLVLGWAAVPAILVALILQAVFFGFGGITALGINVIDIAVPALLAGAVLGGALRRTTHPRAALLLGAAAGAFAVLLTAVLVCGMLALSATHYVPALGVVLATYGPLAMVEAVVTAAAVVLLQRVKPELLGMPHLATAETADG